MEIKSYRARSVQEALALVRADLGPDAAVLHTREVAAGGKWFGGARQIEVIATPEAANPSMVSEITKKAKLLSSLAETTRCTRICAQRVTPAVTNASRSARR